MGESQNETGVLAPIPYCHREMTANDNTESGDKALDDKVFERYGRESAATELSYYRLRLDSSIGELQNSIEDGEIDRDKLSETIQYIDEIRSLIESLQL